MTVPLLASKKAGLIISEEIKIKQIGILKYKIVSIVLFLTAQACNSPAMKITHLDALKIENIPSGSGIVKNGALYYAIGDDSPLLYTLNASFGIVAATPLMDTLQYSGGRIPKSEKPDFEALEKISENELVVFGSGSKSPERDVFIRILLNGPITVEHYAISKLYSNLKQLPAFKDSELNIEAVAYKDNYLFLFNRKKNLIIQFNYPALLAYLQEKGSFPIPTITQYTLPSIQGVEAGFSGATVLEGTSKIIFTASVENTDNAYDDGEILGSFIGMIAIRNNSPSKDFSYCSVPATETALKVESVTVANEVSKGKTEVILITDDDKGNSILLKSMLEW